jgi:hypothetical protein
MDDSLPTPEEMKRIQNHIEQAYGLKPTGDEYDHVIPNALRPIDIAMIRMIIATDELLSAVINAQKKQTLVVFGLSIVSLITSSIMFYMLLKN